MVTWIYSFARQQGEARKIIGHIKLFLLPAFALVEMKLIHFYFERLGSLQKMQNLFQLRRHFSYEFSNLGKKPLIFFNSLKYLFKFEHIK